MSTLKVGGIRGISASSDAITVNASDGTCTANITNNLSNRNLIINGSQDIDQRNSGTEVNPVVSGNCVTDRFKFDLSQASKIKAQQVADGPTGFTKSLKVTSLAATTPGASDYYLLQQNIEGLNSAQLGWGASGAKTVTLSFWVKSSLTGTFGVAIRNSAFNRTNVQTYAISAADTWEKKSISFTGDTSGTWLITNGVGLRVAWDLGGGTDFDAASTGSWLATNDFTTSSCTHLVATNAATWQITGVQLEVSDHATDFEYRDFQSELSRCMRYYEKSYNYGVAPGTATNVGYLTNGGFTAANSASHAARGLQKYIVPKRAVPTIVNYDLSGNSGKCNFPDTSDNVTMSVIHSGFNQASVETAAVSTTDLRLYWHFTADAEL